MESRRGEPYPVHGRQPDANELARAQAALTEALTELSRLTKDHFFGRVDDVVTDLVDAGTGSHAGLDTVHRLRGFSAEHHRIAIELEAAARCCRLVEREINKRVDALLAGNAGGLSAPRRHGPEAQPVIARRRTGLDSWLGGLFRRDRADSRYSGEGPGSVTRAGKHPPPPWPVPLVMPDHGSTAATPSVDIAAMALGPLEVHVAGRLVPKWASLKARAVFQYLLIHQDRPTRREVLMALQWPDHSHNSARNNLNVAQLGELPEALQFGQLAIGNDPCSEAIHRLLMRCYASQRRQQLVSRQYRVCAAALRDEIGVSPSEETTRLFRDLI